MLFLALLLGCSDLPDRDPSDRTPLSATCDDTDPDACLAPFPSNVFTVADDATATGLRLAVDPSDFGADDDASYLDVADGFSRATGVAFAFDGAIDASAVSWDPRDSLAADSLVQVIGAQPGSPDYGRRFAFRTEVRTDGSHNLLIARPAQVLPPASDHVAVALDTIGAEAPRRVRVALGLDRPRGPEEQALAAWHAPTRAVLDAAGVDLARVVRVTSFTTRSHEDVTRRLKAMIAGMQAAVGEMGMEIDAVVMPAIPEVDLIVRGRLTGAPDYLDDDGQLALDADGMPVVVGTRDVEFRITVPAGEGDYHAVLYGHGTGGDVTDDAFDRPMGKAGISKTNIRFSGWTGQDLVGTLLSFTAFLQGSSKSTAGLMQALAGGTAVMTALDGQLGELLSAETIDGEPNPAAGRRPRTDDIAWAGGSMGGTMGAVMISADPRFHTGVLNVPGGGWTHMVPYSLLFKSGLEGMMLERYDNSVDLHLALVMAQGCWDDVDGAVWADEALASGGTFLLQESMDDPVLPNLGTELLASAFHATQFAPALDPLVGLETTDGAVTSGAALEQFRVPNTGQYDVHGFAARSTPAGQAATEQFTQLLLSAWDGAPVMEHPTICTERGPNGACDFTGQWE